MPGSEVQLLVPPPENVATLAYHRAMLHFEVMALRGGSVSVDSCDTCCALVASSMLRKHTATHAPPSEPERTPIPTMLEILADLVDPDDCNFDHHGGCQAHTFLSLEPGEICPQQAAKDILDEYGIDWR
jgi:hypothetical protein